MLPLLLALVVSQVTDAPPLHQWQLTTEHVVGQQLKPVAGSLPGKIVGPVRFAAEKPRAMLFDGNAKARHAVELTDELAKASLPTKEITVEAWVRIDKTQEWGGILGAFQDNGPYEKGWLLGFSKSQFVFAVAAAKGKTLTYLKSRTHLQTGFWYHVVGTFDGSTQRLFINGKLQGVATEQSGSIVYPPKAHFTLGAYRDDDEHFTLSGQIESAAVFATALTAEQIGHRFQARKSAFPDMDPVVVRVEDWPMFLRDNVRSGTSPENLPLPLELVWSRQTRLPPMPSWPDEAKNDFWHNKYNLEERVTYDRAFHLVSVGPRVYFGSSAEDAVFCLDAATGKVLWTYTTEGPVRLAPTVVGERLLFGSDDGHVHCVQAATGDLVWKQLLAPSPRRIAGNGRIISAWPVRTDVFVDKDQAFVCAGVFPSQGVYQYVLDGEDGTVRSQKTIAVTAQGYQQKLFGKLMIGTGRNPAGAFVADLKSQGRDVEREANLSKEYPFAFIAAGHVRFVGGDGKLAALAADTGKPLWSASVRGKVYSLAAVRGRLFASTDTGHIYCFGQEPAAPARVSEPLAAPQYPDDATRIKYQSTAERLMKELGNKKQGYALLLGSGPGWLAYELAQKSDLQIVVREPDEKQVHAARRLLQSAGLAGRVAVHHGPLTMLPYTDGLFNLVACEEPVEGLFDEAQRVARPHGGVTVFKDVKRRGALPGEGEWTHQYGDPGNTACSGDTRLAGELQLQWFGKPGPREMIDRHHRTAAPLYKQGRLFVPGEDRIIAVDAYNGAILWERSFPDSRRVVIFRDASYLALDDRSLFVASKNRCQAVDPETGATQRTFTVPDAWEKREWGHVARPGKVLVGSVVKPGSSRQIQSAVVDRTETYYDFVPLVGSEGLFAHDPLTGKLLWTYHAMGLIPNPTIAASADTLYFVESKDPRTLAGKLSRARLIDLAAKGTDLVALDLATGKERWRQPVDLTKLHHIVYTTVAQGQVVLSGSRNSGQNKKTDKVWYDLHVFDAATGKEKWSVTQNQNVAIGGDHGEQDQHPVVVGNKLFQEPYAYDLESGSRLEWNWPWVGKRRSGCGNLSASASQFFFRNETTSMFDLDSGQAKKVTTETRPGCWINILPVGGLLLAPEASSGCTCNFSVQTSLALTPVRKK